jgi:PAS domain S-box-containing protein
MGIRPIEERQPFLAISWGFMKVLYIGSERSEAQTIASALRGVDEAVSVLWAAQLENAANWLGESRGLDALVMEAPIDGASCLVVLKQLRRLVLPPVVVFIVPDGISPTLDSLHPGAHYVHRNQYLTRDLPVVVTRAIERLARAELERKLAQADKQLAEQQAKYDIGMARAEANWEMVDEQLRAAAQHVEQARHNQELAAADVERLAHRESELSSQLSDAAAAQDALERQLADAREAVAAANQRTEQERVAAASQLDDRQRQFEIQIAHAIEERRGIEAQLEQAIRAREDADERHATAMSEVAQLHARETELNGLLADITASRRDLEGTLTATQAAFEDAVTRATRERLTASKKAAEREAELDSQIRRERAARATLEQTLADATTALDQARRDHVSATSDVERLTQREASLASQITDVQTAREHLERELANARSALHDAGARETELAEQIQHECATRARLEHTMADADAALCDARTQHQSATEEIARLTLREADLSSQLADVQTARDTLGRELADAASALRSATARESDLAEQIQHERATRVSLEQRLADADAALRAAQQQHELALAAAAEELAAREAELASQLADVHATRETLERQLAEATSALAAATAREADLIAELERERATRVTLEQTIADADAAHRSAQEQHEAALSAAAKELAAREAELSSQLVAVHATRETLERQLAEATSALDAAAGRETDLADQVEQERARRTTLDNCIADADAALERVRQDYQTATAEIERLERRESDLASELAEAHRSRGTLERQLADAGTAIHEAAAREAALDEQLQAAASDVERLTERETELSSQLADAQAVRQTIEQTLTNTRARFVEQRQQLEIQLAQAQLEHESRSADLEERARALALERDAAQQSLAELQERTRQLQESLAASVDAFEVSRSESHRLFDHAGVAMFRCTREGALTDVNRALTTVIGRRTYELAGADFAAAVFEAPQALSWLIERCVSTRAKESIETTWRRQDGSRLFMRLSARSLPSGIIEVIAEDLTRLRVLEERLGQAHRMEAIGRLASEVATTCSNLLDNIQQQGREWLMTTAGDADSRQRGERLFDEIGRATGFLQELAACGEEQVRTPMLVDLNTLVRDLEPVLKNVVGGEVEVQLRDTSTPLNVDVGTERIERLLVNLASYGRGRMPGGGRLRIELGTSVVDRHFSAKHPNVRLGLHALITVTESRRSERDASQSRSQRRGTPRPGVDFATLQELVAECGGHLWMKVHPLGEMVAKIRLPLFSPQDQRVPRAVSGRGARERQTARWFQS